MGHPRGEQGTFGRCKFFCRFSAHCLCDLGTSIFKRQTVEVKSVHQESVRKSAHQKSSQKLRAKNLHKKTVSHIPVFRRMEAKTTKTSAPNLRKTPVPRGLGKGAGAKGSPVFLKPSMISLHSRGPLGPRLWAREEESGRVRELLPQKSLNKDRNFRSPESIITDVRSTVTDFKFFGIN